MRKTLIISVGGIALASAAWTQTEEQARVQLAQGVAALDRLNAAGVAQPLRDCPMTDPSEDACVQELKRFFYECVSLEILASGARAQDIGRTPMTIDPGSGQGA